MYVFCFFFSYVRRVSANTKAQLCLCATHSDIKPDNPVSSRGSRMLLWIWPRDLSQINCSPQFAPAAISAAVTTGSFNTIRNAHTIKELGGGGGGRTWGDTGRDRKKDNIKENKQEIGRRTWGKMEKWEQGSERRECESWNDNGKSPSVSQCSGRKPQGATVWYEYQEERWLGEILNWITSPAPSATLLACRQSSESNGEGEKREIWRDSGKLRENKGSAR